MDLASGDEVALEHPRLDEAIVPVGRFQFRQAAFDWAVQRIEAALEQGVGAVVVDEVGPLEMRGDGFTGLLDRIARDYPAVERILLVRTSLVDEVAARFGDPTCLFDPQRNLSVSGT